MAIPRPLAEPGIKSSMYLLSVSGVLYRRDPPRRANGPELGGHRLHRKQIRIKHAKIDKEREAPLSAECEGVLKQYIDAFHGPKAGREPRCSSRRGGTDCHAMPQPMS